MGQNILHWVRLLKDYSTWFRKNQGWDIHNLSTQSVPVSHHSCDNKFLFKPLSVLLLHAQVKKKSSTIYLINTSRYEEAILRCPQSLLFSSTFPHRRCSGLRVFFWSCSYRFMSLLYWGHQNWMIEVRSPESKVDEGESPHSTCWPYCFLWKPGYDWLSRWQAHIATNSCSVLHPSTHPNPSLQAALDPLFHSLHYYWQLPVQVQDLILLFQ